VQVRLDLVRRIKLLEYGLVQERARVLPNTPSAQFLSSSAPVAKPGGRRRRYRTTPRDFLSAKPNANAPPGRLFLVRA
jgi:hypothetical protein